MFHQHHLISPCCGLVLTVLVMASVARADVTRHCPAPPPCICLMGKHPRTGAPEYQADCQNRGFYHIPSFDGSNTTQTIDRIILKNNRIFSIPENAFSGVRTKAIDISHNQISEVHLNAFTGAESDIREFDISNNFLLEWPEYGILTLNNLEYLNLEANHGTRRFENDAFTGLETLRELVIGNCRRAVYFQEDSLKNLSKLESMTIKACGLEKIPEPLKSLKSLKYLNLNSNLIHRLYSDSLRGLKNLRTLVLSMNLFDDATSLSDDVFSDIGNSLENLHMDTCALSEFPRYAASFLKNLKLLDLSNNNLTLLENGSFSSMGNLHSLSLRNNPLEYHDDAFIGLETSLKTLDISSQNLKTLPNVALAKLESLNRLIASENNFVNIDDNFLGGIIASEYNFSHCNIQTISQNTFARARYNLFDLKLSTNNITNLKFISDPCLVSRIDVMDNQLICTCQTYEVTKYPHLLVEGTCVSPTKISGQYLGGKDFDSHFYYECRDRFASRSTGCNRERPVVESAVVSYSESGCGYTFGGSLAIIMTVIVSFSLVSLITVF